MSGAVLAAFIVISLIISLIWRARDQRMWKQNADLLEALSTGAVAIPDTIMPRIDPDRCIGSGACVDACPEKNVIGLVDGRAVLLTPSACVGHSECTAACPVNAIEMVFGTEEHGVAVPEVDDELQTRLPGVYVAGEATGVSLIRNAVRMGRQVAASVIDSGRRGAGEVFDALIIGAGPAGLSAALALQAQGLRVQVVERDVPLATLHGFPKGKRVQTGLLELAGQPKIHGAAMAKEQLLQLLGSAAARVAVAGNESVQALEPASAGHWLIKSDRAVRAAANVIVAMGRRGAARKLEVPGGDAAKVLYGLREPALCDDKHVLVVGGGNAAIESVFAVLDHARPASVTLSYRRARLSRLRADNATRFERELRRGRVSALLGTELTRVEPSAVQLVDDKGHRGSIANDIVIAQLGGISPVAELSRFGITVVEKRGSR
jgi:thioredoxin reductase/Pyruvate/2-oxoacid:ferredoxin oxidoreductase delta subunit